MTPRTKLAALILALGISLTFASSTFAADGTGTTGTTGTITAPQVVDPQDQCKKDGKDDPNCYALLAPLPLGGPNGNGAIDAGNPDKTTNPSAYITGLINLAVAIAGAVAVIQIIIGGFQYITTENFSSKSNARGTIQRALIGLFLAIGAYTILYTINPRLVDLGLTIEPVATSTALTSPNLCAGPIENGVCTQPINPDIAGARQGIGCDHCVKLNALVPQKPPGAYGDPAAGCVAQMPGETAPGPCVVDAYLAQKLYLLAQTMNDKYHMAWQVTEMYPPTVSHDSECHKTDGNPKAGQCVDAALIGIAAAQPLNIINFLSAINHVVGPSFQLEVLDDQAATNLKKQLTDYITSYWNTIPGVTGPAAAQALVDELIPKIKPVGHATGIHVHINYP